ncbi:MAG: hypothetical protein EOP49_18425, partial [Sphingobacteriales bacterium]
MNRRKIHSMLLRAVMIALVVTVGKSNAWGQAHVRDSLAGIYLGVKQASSLLIVDQGSFKALYSAEGIAITPFLYTEIRPAFDGLMVASATYNNFLLNRDGSVLAQLESGNVWVDPVHRQVRIYDYQGAADYYDITDRKFVPYQPIKYLGGSSYEVKDKANGQHYVLREGKKAAIPPFGSIIDLGDNGYRIISEASAGSEEEVEAVEEPGGNLLISNLILNVGTPSKQPKLGLLDPAGELVLPMQYSGIRMLTGDMF